MNPIEKIVNQSTTLKRQENKGGRHRINKKWRALWLALAYNSKAFLLPKIDW